MHVEQFCKNVAERVVGPIPAEGTVNEFGIGIPDIAPFIDMIMQIIAMLSGNCASTSDVKFVKTVRSPGFISRGRFRAMTEKVCRGCTAFRWQDKGGSLSQAMIDQAESMTDAELLETVFTVRNDDWTSI